MVLESGVRLTFSFKVKGLMYCLKRGVVLDCLSQVYILHSALKVKGMMHCLKRRVVLESGAHLTVSFKVMGLMCFESGVHPGQGFI